MADGRSKRSAGDPTTADARLRRILHVLPAARRDGGVALESLAGELGVEPATILRDLEEVTARSLYLPAGPADDLQIHLSPDRVRVWTKGKFARPVKLLTGEALALGLGLRGVAASGDSRLDADEVDALRQRLEGFLATREVDEIEPLFDLFEPAADGDAGGAGGDATGATDPGPTGQGIPGPDVTAADVPGTVFAAARERRPCRIRYLKPGDPEPEARTLHPWAVARAEGRWYAVGRDPGRDDDRTRLFRMDRMLEAELLDGSFTVPGDFDLSELADGGRLFQPESYREVAVRYSPAIARWIREKPWAGGGDGDGVSASRGEDATDGSADAAVTEVLEDGSLVVRHRVADPRWIVRHVLQYGPDAEVLEPEGIRRRVREVVEGVVGGTTEGKSEATVDQRVS